MKRLGFSLNFRLHAFLKFRNTGLQFVILSMEASEIRKKVVELGRELQRKYCSQTRRSSLMFPPAPQSKFVDKFPEVMETKKEQKEYSQQVQYEGEVKVYRILEDMDIGAIVLHGFNITHKLYKLYVRNHECKRKDQEEEGECDFLVIFDDFLAIFEIKVPDFENSSNPDKVFERNYKDSIKQRKRTKDLIYGICKQVKVSARTLTILDFTVFSEADENTVSKFQSYEKLSAEEKRCILFKNCIDEKLFEIFVGQHLLSMQESKVHEKISTTLFGLWYYDDVADRRKPENVELSDTITRLDQQLKISKISRVKPKQKPASSCLVNAPKSLRKLGINFITKKQLSVLMNDKPKLWINGPAGSGKTLIILGKIIQLLEENPSENVVVVVLNEIVAKDYREQLERADICSVIYDHVNDVIFEIETKSHVFIVHFEGKIINKKLIIDESYRLQSISTIANTDHHIFIDDFHGLTAGIGFNKTNEISKIIFTELQSPSRRLFWVTYDILQDGFLNQHVRSSFRMREVVENVTDESCFQSLPAVLRNSRQIAELLSSLRELRLENEKAVLAKVNDLQSSSSNAVRLPSEGEFHNFSCHLSLSQEIGHYIHGPKPRFYWLFSPWSNKTAILDKSREILTGELTKFGSIPAPIVVSHEFYADQKWFSISSQHGIQISTLYDYDSTPHNPDDEIDWKKECKSILQEHFSHSRLNMSDVDYDNMLNVHHFDETFSAEWPAVIGIIEFSRKMFTTDNWISLNDVRFMSNSDSMIDQLLSKIYITLSRARVYCCLILVIRDFDCYIRDKKKTNGALAPNGRVTYEPEELKRAATEASDEFNRLFSTLTSHMILEGNYECKSERDCKMSVV